MKDTNAAPDARAVALDLLQLVLRRGQALDDALAAHDGLAALEARDRAFARNIAATTLRRLGQIDALIDHCLDRALPERASRTRDALRIGVAQLVFLKTPPHAAVDRTVSLLSHPREASFRKLANAIMRRLAREAETLVQGHDAARMNTPDWLWESWSAAFGAENCREIATRHLGEAPLDIVVKSDPQTWARRLDAEILRTGALRRAAGGAVPELPGFAAGEWWVQDAAAALPATLLINGLGGDLAGKRIADLCAAPGGKTAQLAAAGALVTAIDRSAARLDRLTRNLERLGLAAAAIKADAATWRAETPFDAVLLDAPCTGTGTIRRHPDIARLKTADDVARLAGVQSRLLDAAAKLGRPGGVLVYSVCSLQPDEGRARIKDFLDGNTGFERLPVTPDEIGGIPDAVTSQGDLMTLPCHLAETGGLDGFYAARLRR